MKTTRPSRMIGRRVRPNARIALSTGRLLPNSDRDGRARRSLRGARQRVTQKNCAVASYLFARFQAVENLVKAILLQADFDRALGEAVTVDGHPRGRRAVAFAHDAAFRDRRRLELIARANDESRKHLRP